MRIPRRVLRWALWACALGAEGCVPRPEMCSQSECGSQASCVAGRCVGRGAVVAISTARRLVFEPVDVGCVRCGTSGGDGPPPTARLGLPGGPIVLLRFAIDLPPEANVLEAYIDLERVGGSDTDPEPIALHASRIAAPWDERSIAWANLPRLDEVGAPVTRVRAASGPRVRIDVRDIVERWRRRDRDEFGIAVLAEGAGATGMAFALRPTPSAARPPELEPYVK
jgi:hypothetical protein